MKKSLLLTIIVLIGALMLAPEVEAQKKYKRRRSKNKKISSYKGSKQRRGGSFGRFRPYAWVGGGLNAANYFGDLAPVNKAASTDISFTRPGMGGIIGYRMNPFMSARASVNWYRVSGSDFTADLSEDGAITRYARNLSFRNDIFEISGGIEIDLLPNRGGSNSRVPFTPFIFIGGAVYNHTPKGQVPDYDTHNLDYVFSDPTSSPASTEFSNAGDWVNLRQLGTEGQNISGTGVEPYSSLELSVPVAIGVRLRLPSQFDAAIEFGYRHIFTDYIDDVSGDYVDLTLFDDPLARAMSDRSLEHRDVRSGDFRDLTAVQNATGAVYIGDGVRRLPGYGTNSDASGRTIRGNPDDNDKIFVTQIRLTYIFGGVKRKAKFR